MISYEEFEDIIVNIRKRDISSNKQQQKAILSEPDKSLFIVAGPGSGKTTVMVLKILKYIFVDGIDPSEILATTFTKKAADELYSRILGWGDEIKTHLEDKYCDGSFETGAKLAKIERIDFNQITLGTTDSIAEELLRDHKKPGENQSIVIEEFVANSAMIKILIEDEKYLNKNLVEYLKDLSGKPKLEEPSKMSEILMEIKNRLFYDQIDFNELYAKTQEKSGQRLALDCIKEYQKTLKDRNTENDGNITVVGDDDQSLYRFRGATVDLFTNYEKRVKNRLGIDVEEINLTTNYRSTENIIDHCNQFAELDNEYQQARVENKPKIIAPDFDRDKMPILGMFRNNPEMLASDLSRLIDKLVNKGEAEIKVLQVLNEKYYKKVNGAINIANLQKIKQDSVKAGKKEEKIKLKLDSDYGSASDIAILSYSPKEIQYGKRSFLHHLRKNLKRLRNPIEMFNPRGIDLQEIDVVAVFCGLILECIDPEGSIQNSDKTIEFKP